MHKDFQKANNFPVFVVQVCASLKCTHNCCACCWNLSAVFNTTLKQCDFPSTSLSDICPLQWEKGGGGKRGKYSDRTNGK